MIATTVQIYVKLDYLDEFIEASKENHKNSINEPGNLRFDILQHIDDPSRFTFYEVYISEEEALLHKETEHYKKWRDLVRDWMAEDRIGIKHTVIAPLEMTKWR